MRCYQFQDQWAREFDDEIELGEDFTDKVDLASFGRRMILNLRQTLASKILELQKENLYLKYSSMMGQVVTGELYQVWKKEMLLLDEEGNELYLPKQNQIPTDYYRKGDIRQQTRPVRKRIIRHRE